MLTLSFGKTSGIFWLLKMTTIFGRRFTDPLISHNLYAKGWAGEDRSTRRGSEFIIVVVIVCKDFRFSTKNSWAWVQSIKSVPRWRSGPRLKELMQSSFRPIVKVKIMNWERNCGTPNEIANVMLSRRSVVCSYRNERKFESKWNYATLTNWSSMLHLSCTHLTRLLQIWLSGRTFLRYFLMSSIAFKPVRSLSSYPTCWFSIPAFAR